ncbi:subtilisin-like proteinase Mp1 [Myriangium duriaei CBS 260.36]|uniref:Subtilisin-like proteinase Mp1 n=1 Tax=Myriangium duriaei CBS 260.36 TaxID=1168546 RepID=A0A9P4MCE3_9PEZI|nr:subtilisin-like proteinase Mp1 [Myriangium duriaei CBS 260.36]
MLAIADFPSSPVFQRFSSSPFAVILHDAASTASSPASVDVSDRYIVTLKTGVDVTRHMNLVHNLHTGAVGKRQDGRIFHGVSHQYNISNFQAYAGHFDNSVIEQLSSHQDVESVEPDQLLTLNDLAEDQQTRSCFTCKRKGKIVTQKGATWGLHHISHKNEEDPNKGEYLYDSSAGSGTYGYVLDSGIYTKHSDFGGRASLGYNAMKTEKFEDNDGHGTHVAGIMGSKTYGVSKRCKLIAVKVVGTGNSSASILLDGFDWAVNNIIRKKRQAKAVVNISLAIGKNEAINKAVDAAFAQGVTTVTSAGNYRVAASLFSPGSAKGAITVSSTDENYSRAEMANTGPAVAIFAPGVDILSTSIENKKATAMKSGTSFASPYVAGLVLYLKTLHPLPDAEVTRNFLLNTATPGLVDAPGGAKNLYAYNGNGL